MKAVAQSLLLSFAAGALILVIALANDLVQATFVVVWGETPVSSTMRPIIHFILANAAPVFIVVVGGMFAFLTVDHMRHPNRPF
jgi:hypothetical protein